VKGAEARHVWRAVPAPRTVTIWQDWPAALAQDWLGLEAPPVPPPIPHSVRQLLEAAAPLLSAQGGPGSIPATLRSPGE
jgi:hypothetical protein